MSDRTYKKRLTPKSHYYASLILSEMYKGNNPFWVDWEFTDCHVRMLEMFIIEGMTASQIANTGEITGKRGKMGNDMICLWLKRYLPFMEYDEKPCPIRRNKDKEESKRLYKAKKSIPKTPCVICGSTDNLELDHVLTYYAGGRAEEGNLQWLCHECHKKKTYQERQAFNWSVPSNRRVI